MFAQNIGLGRKASAIWIAAAAGVFFVPLVYPRGPPPRGLPSCEDSAIGNGFPISQGKDAGLHEQRQKIAHRHHHMDACRESFLLFRKSTRGRIRCLYGRPLLTTCILAPIFLKKPFQIPKFQDRADTSCNVSRVCKDLIGSGGDMVSPRSRDIPQGRPQSFFRSSGNAPLPHWRFPTNGPDRPARRGSMRKTIRFQHLDFQQRARRSAALSLLQSGCPHT